MGSIPADNIPMRNMRFGILFMSYNGYYVNLFYHYVFVKGARKIVTQNLSIGPTRLLPKCYNVLSPGPTDIRIVTKPAISLTGGECADIFHISP